MKKVPKGYPKTCEGCKGDLVPTIQRCSCKNCSGRYVIFVCNNCIRAWGFDFNSNSWIELEEVKDETSDT